MHVGFLLLYLNINQPCMTIENLIEGIHTLVSHNVIGSKQALSRYMGFRAELFFEDYLVQRYSQYRILDGGIIISKDSAISSLDNSVYITVVSQDAADYADLYKSLSAVGFKQMFIVLYTDDSFSSRNVMEFRDGAISLNVPALTVKQFNIDSGEFDLASEDITVITGLFKKNTERGKSRYPVSPESGKWLMDNLKFFSYSQLLKIYMTRLLFDGFIGFGLQKGKPSDIDFILRRPDGRFRLLEIKEKDLTKNNTIGFGLDVPRLEDLARISNTTGIDYFLVVRQINNQTDREFVSWKKISIKDFEDGVEGAAKVKGGTGMRSIYSHNDTLICPLELFDTLQ